MQQVKMHLNIPGYTEYHGCQFGSNVRHVWSFCTLHQMRNTFGQWHFSAAYSCKGQKYKY